MDKNRSELSGSSKISVDLKLSSAGDSALEAILAYLKAVHASPKKGSIKNENE